METKMTILVADDDDAVTRLVTRTLEPVGCEVLSTRNGLEALAAAQTVAPDLVLLDVRMPGLSGWEVLTRLRDAATTRVTPVIMLTGCGRDEEKAEGFGLGADDYVTKPFSVVELRARVSALLRRHRQTLAVHPLTRLPGSPSIEAEAQRRIREDRAWALIHADIDRFKVFNDAYGYAQGDRAILAAAGALEGGLRDAAEPEGFLGHVGGDDLVVICSAERAELAAAMACLRFDAASGALHQPRDAARGWIEGNDRRGQPRRSPLISLSLGGVSTRRRRLDRYAKAVGLAAEMKSWLKSTRDSGPSAWAFDRRCDPQDVPQ